MRTPYYLLLWLDSHKAKGSGWYHCRLPYAPGSIEQASNTSVQRLTWCSGVPKFGRCQLPLAAEARTPLCGVAVRRRLLPIHLMCCRRLNLYRLSKKDHPASTNMCKHKRSYKTLKSEQYTVGSSTFCVCSYNIATYTKYFYLFLHTSVRNLTFVLRYFYKI